MTLSRRGARRTALQITAVLALAALSLTACGSDSDGSDGAASDPTTAAGAADYGDISVQLSWIKNSEFAGEFLADSKGYYADAGFSKVDLLPGPVAQEEIV